MRVAFNLDAKGEYKMQGFIDRLGVDDEGVLWIHDYKTSSRKLSEEDARNEDQLALYQTGLQQNPKFGPKAQFKLLWHFVAFEKDQVVSERSPKEIDWLKQKYISKIQTIEKAKSYPTKTSPLCGWCEFLTVCAEGQAYVANRKGRGAAAAAKPVIEVAEAPPVKAVPAEVLPPSAQVPAPEKLLKKNKKPVGPTNQLSFFE
jgi:hypothetical protein